MFDPDPPEAPGGDPLDVALAAARAVRAEDRSGWTGAAIGARVEALAALKADVDAALVSAVGAYETTGDWALDGARSMASWLAARSTLRGGDAARIVRTGRFAVGHDDTGDALRTGDVAVGHVGAMAQAVTRERVGLFDRDETVLLDAARQLTVDEFTTVIDRWRQLADDTLADADAKHRQDVRHLHISPTSFGSCPITGDLGPDGIIVQRALDHAMGPPDARDLPEGPRTTEQRRADALIDICDRYLRTTNTKASAPSATVDIIIDADTLTGAPRPIADARCETATGTPLPTNMVRRFLCDSWIGRIILDADREPLDVGKHVRHFTRAQRRAIRVRDNGCVWPGCTMPHHWCDIHHLDQDRTNTTLDNAATLCRIHHTYIHQLRWKLARLDDGTWAARPP